MLQLEGKWDSRNVPSGRVSTINTWAEVSMMLNTSAIVTRAVSSIGLTDSVPYPGVLRPLDSPPESEPCRDDSNGRARRFWLTVFRSSDKSCRSLDRVESAPSLKVDLAVSGGSTCCSWFVGGGGSTLRSKGDGRRLGLGLGTLPSGEYGVDSSSGSRGLEGGAGEWVGKAEDLEGPATVGRGEGDPSRKYGRLNDSSDPGESTGAEERAVWMAGGESTKWPWDP